VSTTAVVILNWNGKHFLEKFLPLLIERTSLPDVLIVIVDNASEDDSCHFISTNFPSVKLVCLDKNYGFTGGYNRGLQHIKADYYVLLNSDVEVTDGWLQPLVKLMDQRKEVGACMPKLLAYDRKDYFEYGGAAGGFLDKYGYPFCRGRILNNIEKDEGQYNDQHEVFWATGACMMVRADLYHQLSGFDERFFAHMEEIDLCWRAKAKGFKVMCEPQAVVYHVGGGTLSNDSPRKIYYNYRNSLYMLYKNLPKRRRFWILMIRMMLDGLSASIYFLRGNPAFYFSVFRAHIDFWRNFRKLSKTPSKRKMSGIYNKSIVWKFFFCRGKLKFSDLQID
jgi:GT2 family glycosyltransferase